MFVDDSELDKFYLIMKERELTDDEFKEMNRIDSLTKTYAKARVKHIISESIEKENVTEEIIALVKNMTNGMDAFDIFHVVFNCECEPSKVLNKFGNVFNNYFKYNCIWFKCFCSSGGIMFSKFKFEHAENVSKLFYNEKQLEEIKNILIEKKNEYNDPNNCYDDMRC